MKVKVALLANRQGGNNENEGRYRKSAVPAKEKETKGRKAHDKVADANDRSGGKLLGP